MHFTLKKALSLGISMMLVIILVLFSYYQSRAIIEGPQILLTEPQNGALATSSPIIIRGVAIHAKELILDGRPIFIDTKGAFKEELLLAEGYNRIELTAKDVRGTGIEKVIELVYHAPLRSELTQ